MMRSDPEVRKTFWDSVLNDSTQDQVVSGVDRMTRFED